MSNYQITAIINIAPLLFPILIVIAVYLGALKSDWRKKCLAVLPSFLFVAMPFIAVITTPNAPQFNRFAHPNAWNILVGGSYLLALFLIVFNVFYIRTKLHFLQALNILFGLLSYGLTVLAVTGDAP